MKKRSARGVFIEEMSSHMASSLADWRDLIFANNILPDSYKYLLQIRLFVCAIGIANAQNPKVLRLSYVNAPLSGQKFLVILQRAVDSLRPFSEVSGQHAPILVLGRCSFPCRYLPLRWHRLLEQSSSRIAHGMKFGYERKHSQLTGIWIRLYKHYTMNQRDIMRRNE